MRDHGPGRLPGVDPLAATGFANMIVALSVELLDPPAYVDDPDEPDDVRDRRLVDLIRRRFRDAGRPAARFRSVRRDAS